MSYDNKSYSSSLDADQRIKKAETEIAALLKSVNENIPNVFSSEQYKEVLQLFSRFHRYSYTNIILIFLQYPEATYIAGIDTWKNVALNVWNNVERPPLKQEQKIKGIRLLAPFTQVKNRQRSLMNFVVSVFDVSQTNDLPPLEQEADYLLNPKINRLVSALRCFSSYRIVCAGRENQILQSGMNGYCDHKNQFIVLNENLKGKKLLAAMFREVVEAEASLLKFDSKEFIDLIKESVLYILNHHFGFCINTEIDSLSFASRYSDYELEALTEALYIIQRVSHKIIEAMDLFLEEIEGYESFAWVDEEAFLEFDLESAN